MSSGGRRELQFRILEEKEDRIYLPDKTVRGPLYPLIGVGVGVPIEGGTILFNSAWDFHRVNPIPQVRGLDLFWLHPCR